jgi:hypothetical protein
LDRKWSSIDERSVLVLPKAGLQVGNRHSARKPTVTCTSSSQILRGVCSNMFDEIASGVSETRIAQCTKSARPAIDAGNSA